MPLQLEHVTFGYTADRPVVEDVSASLTPGRVTAVLGPNAAGKTTLLRLMLGLRAPSRGRITLDGRSVGDLSPRLRARRISYVPQRGAVSFAYTVRRVVAMGRYAHGETAGGGASVEEAIRALDLLPLAERPFVELSGGQQQRVLLARAVAQSAAGGVVMLLDEPAAGLDLRHVHTAMSVVRDLARTRELAVAIVMHDLSLTSRYADDVWLMDRGRLTRSGPCAEVMRPAVLEPVYGVRLRKVAVDAEAKGDGSEGEGSSVFIAEAGGDTLHTFATGS